MSDREAGTLAWSFDDLRRQIDLIEESFENADGEPMILRGFTKGHVDLEAAHGDREYLSIETEVAFGEDAFSRPGDIEGIAKSDLRLFGLAIVPGEYASERIHEITGEGNA